MVALAGAVVALSSTATATTERGDLLPDLLTARPTKIYVKVTRRGRRLLRFPNEVVNVHVGPLELRPRPDDCDGDGVVRNDRTAYQRIYRDGNGDGRFTRGVDVRFRVSRAGCTAFHPEHRHWHFEALAEYALYALAGDGSLGPLVSGGRKVSSCVVDTNRRRPRLPGSPPRRFYGPGGTGCKRDSVGGISIGWGDRYGARVTGQHLDTTGVPDGVYCLVSRADPEDRIVESDDENNERTTRVTLRGNAVAWRPYRPC